jgi:hypothetical protein
MTETNNIIPIKRSYTKKEKYQKEQEEIVKKLNTILSLDEKNNKFIFEDLKSDQNKQNMIILLEEDVKKFFACTRWTYFNKQVDNKWLSLLKAIYKNSNYDIQYKHKMKNGNKYIEYTINKNL